MYYFLSMLNYLLQTSNPNSSFKLRLYALLDDYKHVVNHRAMGFLQDWDKEKCGILIKYLDNKKNSCTFVNLNLG